MTSNGYVSYYFLNIDLMNLTNQFMVLEWKPRWVESYTLCKLFSSHIHLSFPPHINLLINSKPNSLLFFLAASEYSAV